MRPLALLALLFTTTPGLGVSGLLVVAVLHFWTGTSLAWMMVPISALVAWVMLRLTLDRHD
jgi:hypothetical protein